MPETVEIGLAVVTYLAYLQSQYDTFCLDFSLEYLTSAVYLSRSGCTLILGAESEGSMVNGLGSFSSFIDMIGEHSVTP